MREGCEVHTGDLRDRDEARARDGRLHPRDPPRRDRRRDRELPQAPPHAHRGEQRRSTTRVVRRRAGRVGRALHLRQLEHGLRARAGVPDDRGATCPTARSPLSAYGFSKLTGEVYCRAAHDEHGLPFTICRPFNAYGPGEMPDDEPGIAHAVPDLIRKSLAAPAPAADLRLGRADADAHARRRHRRRDRHRHGAPGRPQRGLQHLGERGADRRRDRARSAGRPCGNDPGELALEHLPELRGRRPAPLAVGREGRARCSAGRPDRRPRRHRGRPPSGCASRREWHGRGAR